MQQSEIQLLKARRILAEYTPNVLKKIYKRPVFIVSAPRSGSTLLFETLLHCKGFWSIRAESHVVYAMFPKLAMENERFDSGCLNESHADKETASLFKAAITLHLKNSNAESFIATPPEKRPSTVRLLEKTPRNALNIPFILKLFPDAQFVFLHRRAAQNISSIMEGWQIKKHFVRFTNLPDWPLGYWCFLLPPGWRKLKNKPISEIAAFQWQSCNETIIKDLNVLPRNRWIAVSYEELTAKPQATINKICSFAKIKLDKRIQQVTATQLKPSSTTVSKPSADKWLRHKDEIEALNEQLKPTVEKIALIRSGP